MKGCDNEATCAMNSQDVVVKVVLMGYRKKACAAGDMPVSLPWCFAPCACVALLLMPLLTRRCLCVSPAFVSSQIAMDASSLMKDGKVLFKFGTERCPEGDTEVTYERLKTRMMIDALKEGGKLKAEPKQKGMF